MVNLVPLLWESVLSVQEKMNWHVIARRVSSLRKTAWMTWLECAISANRSDSGFIDPSWSSCFYRPTAAIVSDKPSRSEESSVRQARRLRGNSLSPAVLKAAGRSVGIAAGGYYKRSKLRWRQIRSQQYLSAQTSPTAARPGIATRILVATQSKR